MAPTERGAGMSNQGKSDSELGRRKIKKLESDLSKRMVAPLGLCVPSSPNTDVGGDGVRGGGVRQLPLEVGQHPRGETGRGLRAAEGERGQVAVNFLRDG